jgi:hypothetical protein
MIRKAVIRKTNTIIILLAKKILIKIFLVKTIHLFSKLAGTLRSANRKSLMGHHLLMVFLMLPSAAEAFRTPPAPSWALENS